MKQFKNGLAALFGYMAIFLLASCNDHSDTNGSSGAGSGSDTSLTDTRRNTTDTVNYLTKDTSKQSQEVIDPEPPGGGQ